MSEKKKTDAVTPFSNASNTQTNHSGNAKHVVSVTSCLHGSTVSQTWGRTPADINAANIKALDFLNHQRILPACNCTLT